MSSAASTTAAAVVTALGLGALTCAYRRKVQQDVGGELERPHGETKPEAQYKYFENERKDDATGAWGPEHLHVDDPVGKTSRFCFPMHGTGAVR